MRTQNADGDGLWEVLGCKWTPRILHLLDARDAGFNEIKRAIDGLPASTLSTRLKRLRAEGVVARDVDDDTPPSVTYSLTEKGSELADLLEQIQELERRYE